MHYDVVANGVLWFLHHGMFDRARRPRFDLRFRDAWDAFVAVNQRFADAVAETRRRRARSCSCRTTSSRSSPGSCARSGPTCASCTSPTRRSPAPTTSRCSRPTSASTLCRVARVGPGGLPHQTLGRGVPPVGAGRRSAGAPRSPRRSPRASGPTSPRSRRSRRRPRRAPPRPASPTRSATGSSIARTDRIEPSKNIVRGFLAYDRLLEARPGLRGPGRVRRDGVPVAPGPRRVPRVRERGRTGRRARERPLGDPRLGADPARRPRRLRPVGRGHAALRRAPRERVARRAEPRRQGRARSSTAATACCASRPRPARTRS